jgi:hypothetical protein
MLLRKFSASKHRKSLEVRIIRAIMASTKKEVSTDKAPQFDQSKFPFSQAVIPFPLLKDRRE